MTFTSTAEFDKVYATVRAGFDSGKTKDKKWRKLQLQRTWWMIEDNKERIIEALKKDLNKHRQEVVYGEFIGLQNDVVHTIKNLDEWTKDEYPARSDPLNFLGKTTIRKEPLGVTLILGAWNFPFLLLLQPMVAAIAAGCAVILKPSDLAIASQDLLMEIVPKYLDPEAIRCVTAGPKEMGYILEQRFDHIFYTGSSAVAKIIAAAAAKHLTPVTLELGGQGPAIVCPSAQIDLAAKRIASTKFMNAGQVCLNVNHVFIPREAREAFVISLIKYFDEFLGGKDQQPSYYTHIINERNFDRLDRALNNTKGTIVYGGHRDRATRYFGPTIVTNVKPDDSLLEDELFGPILPIIDSDLASAIATTKSLDHPLALYAFTESKADKQRILAETQSGGVTFNDTLLHMIAKDAPFGGVGNSGQGYYHGPHGVRTFSHLRTHIDPPTWLERALAARYPPYSQEKTVKLGSRLEKATFDREGNEVGGGASKFVVLSATVGAAAYAGWAYWPKIAAWLQR